MQVEQYISRLDTSHFGFGIAKLNDEPADIDRVLGALSAAGVKLVIARVATASLSQIHRLEASGFRLMDVQVTHRFMLEKFAHHATHSGLVVRDLERGDIEQVLQRAAESFDGYGHYAADPRLDRVKCREAYVDWARRSCEDPAVADKFLVATEENTILGFLTFKVLERDGLRYAPGGMGAVGPAYRNRGTFGALVKQGLTWGASIGLAWEEHNALVTNYAVNRVFAGIGFRIAQSTVTMHAWV